MPEVPAVSRISELTDAAVDAFASDGPLAAALDGFEARAGQVEMAEAVATVLGSGGVLLAEAGTGTGKTLAYLVPAILSRKRVLVSTGTKNLQEQIFFKDLPVLREALGVPFTATCMKGRGNYLCLHRFESFRESPALRSWDETLHVRILERWMVETETGDRAEVEDLPEDLPFWNEIAATTENCVGAECPRYGDCFVVKMRQRAAESDIVIVNHHLLCADAAVRQSAFGEVIPRCSHAIVDEAHQLEDVATQYFGLSVSSYRIDDFVRDVDRAIGARLIADGERRDQIAGDVRRIRDDSRRFFSALQMLRFDTPAARGSETRVRVKPSHLVPLGDEGATLVAALEALEADIALAKDVPEDVLALGRRAADIKNDLRFLLRADDTGYVYFLETRGRGVYLRASPIDVSSTIRDLLLDRMDATVLTSATLTVDGTFDYVKGRLGVGRATELKLDSEFDYARQSILYLPKGIPDPRRAGIRRRRGARDRQHPEADVGPRVRSVHQLRKSARGPAHRGCRARVSDPRPGNRAAFGTPARFQGHAARRAPRHVELLAGRRRRGRSAELRHHRQTALRLARRSGDGGARRSNRRARGLAVRRVSDSAGDPHAQAGARPPPPASTGSRRARRPRPAAEDDGLRAALPRVAASCARHPRPARHRALLRGDR